MRKTTWKVRRTPDGWRADIEFRLAGLGCAVGADGPSQRQALARAAAIANQLAQSPILAAVAPPGTAAAVKAISALAKSRDVRAALSRFRGPGARRLARSIFGRL